MSQGMLVTFIFSDFLWPDLDLVLFKHDLRSHAVGTLVRYIIAFWVSLIFLQSV